jgi:hypothetical protein
VGGCSKSASRVPTPGQMQLRDSTSWHMVEHSRTGMPCRLKCRACGWRPILARQGTLGSKWCSANASKMARSSSWQGGSQEGGALQRVKRTLWAVRLGCHLWIISHHKSGDGVGYINSLQVSPRERRTHQPMESHGMVLADKHGARVSIWSVR